MKLLIKSQGCKATNKGRTFLSEDATVASLADATSISVYDLSNSSWTSLWAVSIQLACQLFFLKYSSLCRGWRTKRIKVSHQADGYKRSRTHGNTIDFWGIRLIVVLIHGLIPNSKGHVDCKTEVVWRVWCCRKHIVNNVHGRNYCRKIRGASRKEKCCIFKNLKYGSKT